MIMVVLAQWLKFAKLHVDKPQDFWNNVLWTDETKVEISGHNAQQHIWRKPNTTYEHKHVILTVKHSGGGVIIWACFTAAGPRHLALIESTMNSSVYQSILDSICLTAKSVRTMISSTQANLQYNGWGERESRCCNGPVKSPDSVKSESCGGTFRELSRNKCWQTSVS